MASDFPLYVYVILVSFGGVLCAGDEGDASSSPEHWMSGKKMTNVSLIKPYWHNEELPGGFIQTNLVEIDGTDTWCWDFFKTGHWVDVDGGKGKHPDDYYFRFIEDGIYSKKRKGKKVKFGYKPKGATLSNEYVFDFADDEDAMKFTGEVPGQQSTKCPKLFSGCV